MPAITRPSAIKATVDPALQVDVLVATVGSNPLPIAVVARLVLRPGGLLVLVHTAQTERLAEALLGLLGPAYDGYLVRKVVVADSDPAQILGTVRKVVAEQPPEVSIGLDFTGGTKAMSVFAAAAVADANSQRGHRSFYLDARTDSLRTVIHEPTGSANGPVINVSLLPVLELEEVMLLHGFEPQGPLTPPNRQLTRTAQCLAEILNRRKPADTWRKWAHALGQCYRPKESGPWHDTPQNDPTAAWDWSPLTNARRFDPLIQALREETGICIDQHLKPADVTAALGWREGEFLAWLHGRWLEQHVYTALEQLPPELGLRPRGVSLRAWLYRSDASGSYAPDRTTEFEVDVVASRGYRLWGFSCATSQRRAVCKTKLFEAAQRMTQLGGSESQTVLVSGSDQPQELERQTETLFRSHVRPWAFGAADLPHLTQRLADRLSGA